MGAGASALPEAAEIGAAFASAAAAAVDAAVASPPKAVEVLETLQHRIAAVRTEGVLPAGTVEALERRAAQVLDQSRADDAYGDSSPATVAAICRLSGQVVSAVEEEGLTTYAVAELLCEGLAAAAAVLAPGGANCLRWTAADFAAVLEPLGEALDGFVVQIAAQLRRLDAVVVPRWTRRTPPDHGSYLQFAEGTGQFQVHYKSLRFYQALQGVCVWTLALVVRAAEGSFAALRFWELCSKDALCATIFAKSILCFHQAESDTSLARIPHDVDELRETVVAAALGLCSQDVAFVDCVDANPEGNVGIAERNRTLMRHHAKLAAAAADNQLLDSLLAYSWAAGDASSTSVRSLASFLAALDASGVLPDTASDVTPWRQLTRENSKLLWHEILIPLAQPRASFLRDCAWLAGGGAPPPEGACLALIKRCLVGNEAKGADEGVLASLVALAASAGYEEDGSTGPLTGALAALNDSGRTEVLRRLEAWTPPLGASGLHHQRLPLQHWLPRLAPATAASASAAPATPSAPAAFATSATPAAPTAPAASAAPAEVAEAERRGPPGLRELLDGAPAKYRCALDGKLLVDPVQSPQGHVFERSVLARALDANGSTCPLTGAALSLADCRRHAELRLEITRWIRTSRPRQKLA